MRLFQCGGGIKGSARKLKDVIVSVGAGDGVGLTVLGEQPLKLLLWMYNVSRMYGRD